MNTHRGKQNKKTNARDIMNLGTIFYNQNMRFI